MSWRDRIANAILGGKVGGPTPSGIHVYHSSPHDFDRFDLSKIGTGEGAQVYGHGIYAAENPAVSGQGGQYWQQFLNRFPETELAAAERLKASGFNRGAAIAETQKRMQDLIDHINMPAAAHELRGRSFSSDDLVRYREQIKNLQNRLDTLQSGAPVGPRTYEVNFRAKPEELLDWDKPLKGQPEKLNSALDKIYPVGSGNISGSDYYNALARDMYQRYGHRDKAINQAYASQTLADAGIPGIRYLDEGSRMYDPIANAMVDKFGSRAAALEVAQQRQKQTAFGDLNKWDRTVNALSTPQTHNYVAFDPSRLDIMAKYGVVGGVPLGALAATDQYGAQP